MSNSDNHEDKDFIMSEEDKTEDTVDSYEYESDDISNAADRKPSMLPSIRTGPLKIVLVQVISFSVPASHFSPPFGEVTVMDSVVPDDIITAKSVK